MHRFSGPASPIKRLPHHVELERISSRANQFLVLLSAPWLATVKTNAHPQEAGEVGPERGPCVSKAIDQTSSLDGRRDAGPLLDRQGPYLGSVLS